jgi:hypothetical protein
LASGMVIGDTEEEGETESVGEGPDILTETLIKMRHECIDGW